MFAFLLGTLVVYSEASAVGEKLTDICILTYNNQLF